MVDGANRLTSFHQRHHSRSCGPASYPPRSLPSCLPIAIFLLVRILTQSNWTLTVAISKYAAGEDPGHITLAAAAAVSAAVPIIIIVFIFQGQLVKGLTAGAVKG